MKRRSLLALPLLIACGGAEVAEPGDPCAGPRWIEQAPLPGVLASWPAGREPKVVWREADGAIGASEVAALGRAHGCTSTDQLLVEEVRGDGVRCLTIAGEPATELSCGAARYVAASCASGEAVWLAERGGRLTLERARGESGAGQLPAGLVEGAWFGDGAFPRIAVVLDDGWRLGELELGRDFVLRVRRGAAISRRGRIVEAGLLETLEDGSTRLVRLPAIGRADERLGDLGVELPQPPVERTCA